MQKLVSTAKTAIRSLLVDPPEIRWNKVHYPHPKQHFWAYTYPYISVRQHSDNNTTSHFNDRLMSAHSYTHTLTHSTGCKHIMYNDYMRWWFGSWCGCLDPTTAFTKSFKRICISMIESGRQCGRPLAKPPPTNPIYTPPRLRIDRSVGAFGLRTRWTWRWCKTLRRVTDLKEKHHNWMCKIGRMVEWTLSDLYTRS